MKSSEHEPVPTVNFLEVTQWLNPGDGLLLSRNKLQILHEDEVVYTKQVEYSGLNELFDAQQPVEPGRLVTSEFQLAVEQILSERRVADESRNPGEKLSDDNDMYPILSVFNEVTMDYPHVTMDIARLIDEGELNIYARSDPAADSGEVLVVGVNELVRTLAGRAGVDPARAIIADDKRMQLIEDKIPQCIEPSGRQVSQLDHAETGYKRRSVAILALLQMQLADSFKAAREAELSEDDEYEDGDARLEVSFDVSTMPKTEELLVELIKMVESKGFKLCYAKAITAMDEPASSFVVVDDKLAIITSLSFERGLPMAIYNAYLTAPIALEV